MGLWPYRDCKTQLSNKRKVNNGLDWECDTRNMSLLLVPETKQQTTLVRW